MRGRVTAADDMRAPRSAVLLIDDSSAAPDLPSADAGSEAVTPPHQRRDREFRMGWCASCWRRWWPPLTARSGWRCWRGRRHWPSRCWVRRTSRRTPSRRLGRCKVAPRCLLRTTLSGAPSVGQYARLRQRLQWSVPAPPALAPVARAQAGRRHGRASVQRARRPGGQGCCEVAEPPSCGARAADWHLHRDDLDRRVLHGEHAVPPHGANAGAGHREVRADDASGVRSSWSARYLVAAARSRVRRVKEETSGESSPRRQHSAIRSGSMSSIGTQARSGLA
jgi:hypothetical protein